MLFKLYETISNVFISLPHIYIMDYKKEALSTNQAAEELSKYGPNEIHEVLKISWFKALINQIKGNFIIYLLFIAMLLSFFVNKSITAYVILAVIVLVITVGFFQEYKAEKAIKALKSMIMPVSIVIRNGQEQEILSREIVPGDILILRTGEKIPADALIIEEKEITIDESIITGESAPVTKTPTIDFKDYKKENIILMGTNILSGRCIARVLHTGMNTEFGKIAGMISTAEKKLPLKDKINHVARYMAFIAIIISLLTGLIMILRIGTSTQNLTETLIVVIALAVSAFPEGFPVVLITALSSGAYRMAKRNAIVNRMSIIETLGETTVICADKTGTITKGEMTVNKIYADNSLFDITGEGYSLEGKFLHKAKKIEARKNKVLNLLLRTSVLCNDALIARKGIDSEQNILGSPTEASLLILAGKAGVHKEDIKFERIEEVPFSSERKMMSVLCRESSGKVVYSKGATEYILGKCKMFQTSEGLKELSAREKSKIIQQEKQFTSSAFRVLALAYKPFTSNQDKNFERGLIFLGLVAIQDPPRKEVKQAIEICLNAGIHVKMITGDNRETAIAVANEINLSGKIMTGQDLDKITEHELSKIVKDIVIFARVKPEHKLKIIKALKMNGEIVTMTGDGVNDAPALKEAHIGVSMATGTDVSREVSDMTLKDDNFASIVYAVEEGRTIFNNIRKFVTYQLSCNFAELFIVFIGVLLSPIFGWEIPILLALQILFMNLVTDDMPAISLTFNPSSLDVMSQKPRKKSRLMTKDTFILLAFIGIIMGIFTLVSFYVSFNVLNESIDMARTTALLTLIMFEIANAFSFRSLRTPVFKIPFFSNKYLVYASGLSILATICIIYIPVMNTLFHTTPLPLINWIFSIIISLSIILVFDIFKIINEKKKILDLS